MSILHQPRPLNGSNRPGPAAGWFAAFVLVSLAGGALLAYVFIRPGLDASSGFWHDLIQDKGAPRVMRRIQTLLAVLLAPWLLRKVGWRGLSDVGWLLPSDQSRLREAARGFLLGLLLMGGLMAVSMVGVRHWDNQLAPDFLVTLVSGFLVTGLAVGVVEETFSRGVLYRTLARVWTSWPAAIVSSGLFAYLHFLKATPESFDAGPLAVVRSSFLDGLQAPHAGLHLFNLFLLGLVLCRMVERRGHIWMAVGFHAAAVGMIVLIAELTDINREIPLNPWIGHHAGFVEGRLCAVLLLALLAWSVVGWKTSPEGGRVRL